MGLVAVLAWLLLGGVLTFAGLVLYYLSLAWSVAGLGRRTRLSLFGSALAFLTGGGAFVAAFVFTLELIA